MHTPGHTVHGIHRASELANRLSGYPIGYPVKLLVKVLIYGLDRSFVAVMVPQTELFRHTSSTRRFAPNAKRLLSLFAAAGLSLAGSAGVAYAAGFGLDDDSALIIGSDSVVYSLNLSTGVATAGATMDTPTSETSYSALEADPTNDIAYVGTYGDGSLDSVLTSDGTTTAIAASYGNGTGFDGLVRLDDGTSYAAHTDGVSYRYEIATVDLSTGVLTGSVQTTLSSVNERVMALAAVDAVTYAFVMGDADTLYSVDTSTGALTSERASSGVVNAGEHIVAADTSSADLLYLLGYNASTEVSTLYSLDPASGGSTTEIATISGIAVGETAETLAIATLLDSERPDDSRSDSASSSSSSRDDDEEEEVVVAPAPEPPVYVAPTKTLEEVVIEEAEPEPVVVEGEEAEPDPVVVEVYQGGDLQPEPEDPIELFEVGFFLAGILAVLVVLAILVAVARRKAAS